MEIEIIIIFFQILHTQLGVTRRVILYQGILLCMCYAFLWHACKQYMDFFSAFQGAVFLFFFFLGWWAHLEADFKWLLFLGGILLFTLIHPPSLITQGVFHWRFIWNLDMFLRYLQINKIVNKVSKCSSEIRGLSLNKNRVWNCKSLTLHKENIISWKTLILLSFQITVKVTKGIREKSFLLLRRIPCQTQILSTTKPTVTEINIKNYKIAPKAREGE